MEASATLNALRAKGWKLATAESCTGGLIAKLLTDIAGSSDVFQCGFVTYANAAKTRMLGVSRWTLYKHGAVSAETATAMAQGARKRAKVDVAVATTGIAGPSGGTETKPVGLVFIAVATKEKTIVEKCLFTGTREDIRTRTAARAFEMVLRCCAE
jgi:PncC family amidohydrolase